MAALNVDSKKRIDSPVRIKFLIWLEFSLSIKTNLITIYITPGNQYGLFVT